jgi:hypothetical protein
MKTYLVGGAVRDKLMGKEPMDRDWVVTGATPQEMTFKGFKQVGADFPVFLHPETGHRAAGEGGAVYVMITSRCNMSCEHCCQDATEVGEDMTTETFKQAARVAYDYGGDLCFGGGEPTLHPELWTFLGIAMDYELETIGMVTNGTNKSMALRMLALARGMGDDDGYTRIWCDLSRDYFHDDIDQEVVRAFEKAKRVRTCEGHRVLGTGRGKDISDDQGCVCEDFVVEPDGKVWYCGCREVQCGDIWDLEIPERYRDDDGHCSRRIDRWYEENPKEEEEAA